MSDRPGREEWPLAERAAGPSLLDRLRDAWASPAIAAFVQRRAEQILRHGHSRAADRDRPAAHLVAQAKARLADAIDHADSPEGRAIALRKIEIAGALLMAAHDRISGDMGVSLDSRSRISAAPAAPAQAFTNQPDKGDFHG